MNAKSFVTAIAVVVLAASVSTANVQAAVAYSGAENVICDGLTGLIVWDVTENQDGSWHYLYFFQATGTPAGLVEPLPLIGQFCIQTPMSFTAGDILNLAPTAILDDVTTIVPTCGGMAFHAARFLPLNPFSTDTATSNILVEFDSPFAPGMGHFWVELIDQNGEPDMGPRAIPGEFVELCAMLIAVPSNGELPVIPEPLTMLALGSTLIPLATKLRRRIRR
jgi:hypothetical protein